MSILDHAKKIIEDSGIKGLWNGFIPGLILVSNPVINFVVYEKLKNMFEQAGPLSSDKVFMISLASKFCATIVTYPILTIKTKAFTDKSGKSTMTILNEFLKTQGYQGLYRGLFTKLFQTLLYNAFMMMFFEKIRSTVATMVGSKTL